MRRSNYVLRFTFLLRSQQFPLPRHQLRFVLVPISRQGDERRPAGDKCRVDAEFLGASALTQEDVWAVGIDSGSFTCHWDGASWTKVPSPNPGSYGTALYAVAMIASNDVWAVGQTIYPNETVTLHWDGNSWTRVPSPSPSSTSSGNILYGVAAMSSTDVWAVGTGQAGLILHWNGKHWLVISHPAGQ